MATSYLRTVETDVSDIMWVRVRQEAERVVHAEPALASFIIASILAQPTLEAAITQRLSSRLGGAISAEVLRQTFIETALGDPGLRRALRLDIVALLDRDPATQSAMEPVLYVKGFHALQTHRLAHALWNDGRKDFALYLQDRASEVFQVDIHPAVPIGAGMFIDHATGIVIGETATIGENVSMLQGVTLGADSSATRGDRHPKVGRGVMIGAGARIFGNIEIGRCSRIGAGSVVLESVAPNTTVAGVPARVIGHAGCAEPSRLMDQIFYDVGL
jgi:serine O-acetyltransferase